MPLPPPRALHLLLHPLQQQLLWVCVTTWKLGQLCDEEGVTHAMPLIKGICRKKSCLNICQNYNVFSSCCM